MIDSLLKKIERLRPFSEAEAWGLFRIAAFGEAIGWGLLIIGILCKHFLTHGNDWPVLLAGRIHGTLFLLYIVAALGLYPSLGWSRIRTIIAGLASAPPFGSLLFEQWASYRRRTDAAKTYHHLIVYRILLDHI